MIFIQVKNENLVQVGDQTRIDSKHTFITDDEGSITLVEIRPTALDNFYDVTSSRYLDWVYTASATNVATIRVTTTSSVLEKDVEIVSLTEEEENLFSTDQDITLHEGNILDFVRQGRSSFIDKHRAAQQRILAHLDEIRVWSDDGGRINRDQVTDIQELKTWSKFLALQLIFEELSNANDDIFSTKASKYKDMANEARNRAALRLDYNKDGETDDGARDMRSVRILRR